MVALLLLLAASWSRIQLVNEDFVIPAHDRWAVGDPLTKAGWVYLDFRAAPPGSQVRVVLVSRDDWHAWLANQEHDEIAATSFGPQGTLREYVHEPDLYVVIENRGAQPATVHLRVLLELPQVRVLSRGRQFAVIAISFALFFGIVSISAAKLLKAIKKS